MINNNPIQADEVNWNGGGRYTDFYSKYMLVTSTHASHLY